MIQYAVRERISAYEDEDLPIFDSYEDASEYIETHPLTEDGYTNHFEIIKRYVGDWEAA